jgi:phage protein D
MTPDFLLLANAEDVTGTLRRRFISLRITDEAGTKSDTAEIVLDDRDSLIQWPEHGAILDISLGYQETGLSRLGSYIVDEVAHSGPPDTLTVRAKAADMIASLKAPKTRQWEQQSLGHIVDQIAGEHGLQPRVSQALDQIVIPHVDQTEESDLHFLTRLARQYDAVAKPASGFLLFVVKGEAKAASGRTLSSVSLVPSQIVQHRMTQADRGKYTAVRTFWHDVATADRVAVLTGSGEPVFTVRQSYPDAAQAADAGAAKLNALQRGEASLSLTLIGNTGVQAEAELSLSGLRDNVNGLWLIKRVEHQLDTSQGFITRLDADIPAA